MTEEPEPRWINKEQVLRIQELQIERHGGLEGIRDVGLLESAIFRPQHHYVYQAERNLFAFAALYAEGIIKNHPFNDGNKRTAHTCAALFLMANGYELQVGDEAAHLALFEDLAAGKVTHEELTAFYRDNVTERE